VIVVGLPEHAGRFFRITHNPNILLEHVSTYPESMSAKDLVHRTWSIMEPYVHAASRRVIERFAADLAHDRAVDALMDVAAAVTAGRVHTLMVEAERQIPGHVRANDGMIVFDDLDQPDMNDVLDELAINVMRTGGDVLVLPAALMPCSTGAAALLRY
jgi:stalled ribosome rescue protein Dom34